MQETPEVQALKAWMQEVVIGMAVQISDLRLEVASLRILLQARGIITEAEFDAELEGFRKRLVDSQVQKGDVEAAFHLLRPETGKKAN